MSIKIDRTLKYKRNANLIIFSRVVGQCASIQSWLHLLMLRSDEENAEFNDNKWMRTKWIEKCIEEFESRMPNVCKWDGERYQSALFVHSSPSKTRGAQAFVSNPYHTSTALARLTFVGNRRNSHISMNGVIRKCAEHFAPLLRPNRNEAAEIEPQSLSYQMHPDGTKEHTMQRISIAGSCVSFWAPFYSLFASSICIFISIYPQNRFGPRWAFREWDVCDSWKIMINWICVPYCST